MNRTIKFLQNTFMSANCHLDGHTKVTLIPVITKHMMITSMIMKTVKRMMTMKIMIYVNKY